MSGFASRRASPMPCDAACTLGTCCSRGCAGPALGGLGLCGCPGSPTRHPKIYAGYPGASLDTPACAGALEPRQTPQGPDLMLRCCFFPSENVQKHGHPQRVFIKVTPFLRCSPYKEAESGGWGRHRMAHLPFSTHGLFFIRSGFRNGSLGIPSSIHLRSLCSGRAGRVRRG